MSVHLDLLDFEFDQMILASYPNVMIPEKQRRDLRYAFFGGIRIALNALWGQEMTATQMEDALREFIQGVKESEGIASPPDQPSP